MPWTALQTSLRERRWRHVGQAVALVALLVSLIAAARAVPPNLVLAASVLAIAAVIVGWPRPRRRWEIAVTGDGTVVARRPQIIASVDRPDCVFASTWLITLRARCTLIAVWPDSLPRDVYRRLWVTLRWHMNRPDGAAAPGDAQ